ncbi:hypothetical protein TeGR_g13179 [Tetraparma gracilis]|uniref:HMG box domain-containing protein n=1 Tax=Tetraparma gracilis TaxID=2962635 RepID=A0ABQ6MVV7_9STRA|nr:hypothetical protein TeGR_g13179 [Tetraparma gracilis]
MAPPKEDRSGWVAVESEFSGTAALAVAPAVSAYSFFQKLETSSIKASLPPGSDFGAVASAVSGAWRGLAAGPGEHGRGRYERLAAEDRERHARECGARDEQMEAESERRRNLLRGEVAEGERRGAAGRQAEEYERRERERREREARQGPRTVSREVQEGRDRAREEKAKKAKEVDANLERLRVERSAQAKKRLDYLMAQSDIFSHFGKVKTDEAEDGRGNKAQGGGSPSKRSRALTPTPAAGDAGGEEGGGGEDGLEDEGGGGTANTFLTKQPSTIAGGNPELGMRAYQLEGLNWMIKLQEHGVNGILADEHLPRTR